MESTTVAYPKTFFESLRDSMEYLEDSRRNDAMSKEDVLDGMEKRLCFMLSKMLATPSATSYSVFRMD